MRAGMTAIGYRAGISSSANIPRTPFNGVLIDILENTMSCASNHSSNGEHLRLATLYDFEIVR